MTERKIQYSTTNEMKINQSSIPSRCRAPKRRAAHSVAMIAIGVMNLIIRGHSSICHSDAGMGGFEVIMLWLLQNILDIGLWKRSAQANICEVTHTTHLH